MLRAVICFLVVLNFTPVKCQDDQVSDYILTNGFIYHPEKVANEEIYKEGVWGLYFYLEQNISVAPEIRNFLRGNLMALFRITFGNDGEIETVTSEENYLWYNIDAWGKPLIKDLITGIKEAPGWKKNYEGEVYFPLRFKTTSGRISIDYNFFMLRRGVMIGDK